MPYYKKATREQLSNLLPHKWKLKYPECVLTKQTIATATIRFIVTVAIVVYKGLIPVVGRMLTFLTAYFLFAPYNINSLRLMLQKKSRR